MDTNQRFASIEKCDTQAVLLLVFAPDDTKFEGENIIDVKGPFENGYFLIRMKTGSSIDIFKQFHQVVTLNGETYKNFASLPLHKTEPTYLKITSQYMTIKSRTDSLFKLEELMKRDYPNIYTSSPFYDYVDPFILASGDVTEAMCHVIRFEYHKIERIPKDVFENYRNVLYFPDYLMNNKIDFY